MFWGLTLLKETKCIPLSKYADYIAEKGNLDMDNPRPNNFRTNQPPPERYLQLSDWKSGTNCSSSGTCAEKEIFILDLNVLLRSTVKCFIWKIGQPRNLPSANQASWSWLRSWNNSRIKNRRHQNENSSAGEKGRISMLLSQGAIWGSHNRGESFTTFRIMGQICVQKLPLSVSHRPPSAFLWSRFLKKANKQWRLKCKKGVLKGRGITKSMRRLEFEEGGQSKSKAT